MKTITLDDVAYERLKAWKRGNRESFSSVVKRMVPESGTLGALLGFAQARHTAGLPGNEEMERSVEERSAEKHDPWS